jgi:hypothetical protein
MMPEAQVVVDTGALMRQLIAEEKAKRERKRRGSRSSRKSRSGSSGKQMSPIQEVGEWRSVGVGFVPQNPVFGKLSR